MVTKSLSNVLEKRRLTLAIGGNPNSGKTTLFNRLTGLRQKVAKYSGATVEKIIGDFRTANADVQIIDLPGTYGLTPTSEEERIAAEVILGLNKEVPPPDGVLCVVDSTCLEKSLYLVLQVAETGIPAAALLNMSDELELRGSAIDHDKLSRLLGIPVLPISATKGSNLDRIEALIDRWPARPAALPAARLPVIPSLPEVAERRRKARVIADAVITKPLQPHPWSDKVDAVVMHNVWGPLLFGAIVLLVFQADFFVGPAFDERDRSGLLPLWRPS